jgi:lipoprotein-anchoring transpeptidase ErfK/SrfK
MHYKKIWGGLAVGCGLLIGGYLVGVYHYQTHFLPQTVVLKTNIGQKSIAQAAKLLAQGQDQRQLTLTDQKQTVAKATAAQLGLTTNFKPALQQLKHKQNSWAWPFKLSTASAATAKVANVINDQQLQAYCQQLAAKENPNRTVATDDAVTFDQTGKVVVTHNNQGNQISATALAKNLRQQLLDGGQQVALADSYEKPDFGVGTPKFDALKTRMEALVNDQHVVQIGTKKVKLTADQLLQTVQLTDHDMVATHYGVATLVQTLSANYNQSGTWHKFHSTHDGEVKVYGGLYGEHVDQTKTVKQLQTAIANGKGFTQKAAMTSSGTHVTGVHSIGNTYVEVDLKQQKEYYYRNGKLVLHSDIVSGDPTTGGTTPAGVYYIRSKQQGAVLRGQNNDGSAYASPVNYWMPIDDTGVGLHDSSWQPTYGGTWYIGHGSHGCINNPPSFIAKLYPKLKVGTPVVIYDKAQAKQL